MAENTTHIAETETTLRPHGAHVPAWRSAAFVGLLVFTCFTLTTATWMDWLYHIMEFVPPAQADGFTMIGGYACQAIGICIAALVMRRQPRMIVRDSRIFISALIIHFACAVPAIASTSLGGTLAFGYLMGLACGVIAACYLTQLAYCVAEERRGIVFGVGYACSITLTWLLSTIEGPLPFLTGIPVCGVLSLAAIGIVFARAQSFPAEGAAIGEVSDAELEASRDGLGASRDGLGASRAGRTIPAAVSNRPGVSPGPSASEVAHSFDLKLIVLACATVLMMSLVKNLGFSFPSADIEAGISVEFSRLFYATGLVIAGIVADQSRKYGAICCAAALVTPFVLLALSGEPISGLVLWAIDYFFYGFFSVFRIVLFADMAARSGKWHLAAFGLLFGRLGDALGTGVNMVVGQSTVVLVAIAALAFVGTMFAFFRLFNELYQPVAGAPAAATAPAKDSQLAFEEFSTRFDLSSREREVLRLVLVERTNAEIAAELFVTESTVKFHVRNLLKKTSCKNRQELRAAYSKNV